MDQDAMGMQGRRASKQGELEEWVKQLHDGSRAVVLFNRGASEAEISANWEELGYPSGLPAVARDLWNKKELGTFVGKFSAKVVSHGVVMVRIMPQLSALEEAGPAQ